MIETSGCRGIGGGNVLHLRVPRHALHKYNEPSISLPACRWRWGRFMKSYFSVGESPPLFLALLHRLDRFKLWRSAIVWRSLWKPRKPPSWRRAVRRRNHPYRPDRPASCSISGGPGRQWRGKRNQSSPRRSMMPPRHQFSPPAKTPPPPRSPLPEFVSRPGRRINSFSVAPACSSGGTMKYNDFAACSATAQSSSPIVAIYAAARFGIRRQCSPK